MNAIETPKSPDVMIRKRLTHSVVTILWWVGIWGLSETLLTMLVKNSITYRFLVYTGMIAIVFVLLLTTPEIVENF